MNAVWKDEQVSIQPRNGFTLNGTLWTEKPLINARSRSAQKASKIPFNEEKSKGFPSRKAHTRFFLSAASFSGRWKAAANVPLTLIMNHLALHDNFIFPLYRVIFFMWKWPKLIKSGSVRMCWFWGIVFAITDEAGQSWKSNLQVRTGFIHFLIKARCALPKTFFSWKFVRIKSF